MDQVRAAIGRRLDQLAAERPDLQPALVLQRTLLSRQVDLLEVLKAGGLPGLSLPPGYVAAKLRRRVPALYHEPIPLPSRLLEASAREFCDRLAEGGAGDAAKAVGHALDSGALNPGVLLSACFGRDQRRVRLLAAHQGVSPDIAWLVAELALAPFAHLLQMRVLADAAPTNPALGGALHEWACGFCPACGSWPAVVEVIGGRHHLRCSFCAAAWARPGDRCLYCGNDGESFVTAAPDPEQAGRRLQLCGACGGYVKVLEGLEPVTFPLISIEDLASMELDVVAIDRKYLRPPLPEITRR